MNSHNLHSLSIIGTYPLEEGMATHPTILAWRIPWAEELQAPLEGYSPWAHKALTEVI